ncbi:MAG TPA: hypothetical protein VGE50_05900 [Gammaproteobacteria bacterium]
MIFLLQAFWRILLLREPPHTIPFSHLLLGGALLLHLLSGMAFLAFDLPFDEAILSALLSTVLLVAASYLLLSLFGLGRRVVQSVTALAGCEVLINLIGLPVNFWLAAVEKANAALPALLMLLLLGWDVALVAHVWRHALGISKLQGFLYAIAYAIISFTLATLIGAPEG